MSRRIRRQHGPAVALIASGGAVGALSRYGVEVGVGASLPATLLANVVGCFLLGLVMFDGRGRGLLSGRLRLLVGTGFCSSFTTYSTFALDAVTSAPAVAVGYVLSSYGLGFAGIALAGVVVGRRTPEAPGAPSGGDD